MRNKIPTYHSSRSCVSFCQRSSGPSRPRPVSLTFIDQDSSDSPSRHRFGRVGPPYRLTVAGKTLYVLTDPQDFSTVYRNGATFTFDPLVEYIYRVFQLPEATIQILYRKPLSPGARYEPSNPPKMDAVNIPHKILLVEMRGKHPHSQYVQTTRQLRSMIALENICSRFSTIRDGSTTVVSLFQFCSIVMITIGQASHFGCALSDIDSSLPDAFLGFDELCWQIFHLPPILWSKRLVKCKTQLLKALEAYSRKPLDQRPDMPQFLQNWEIESMKLGLRNSDIAIFMLVQYFG